MRADRLVGRACRGGADVLLGLPAPRQPRAGARSRPRTAPAGEGGGRRRRSSCASSRFAPTARPPAASWSYCRDVGGTRIVVVDSRAGRVLEEGRRSMVDEEEWDWITEHATGDVDHLLIATSLPFLLGRGMHYVEAWGEAVAGGAWGRLAARAGERLRRTVDLEHWAAFQTSFAALAELQRAVAAGERGAPPASIVTLSGDVHHAYLFEVAFPRGSGARSAVWQAVCSPYRNPLDKREQRVIKLGMSRPAAARRPAARPRGGRGGPAAALAPGGRRPLVRQPGGHAHDRGSRDRDAAREGGSGGRDERAPRVRAGAAPRLRPQLRAAGLFSTDTPPLEEE